MYQFQQTGRNIQTQMRDMLILALTSAEINYGAPGRAPEILAEFDAMLNGAASTVVGVPDRPKAINDYVEYHYSEGRTPKPEWYAGLTPGDPTFATRLK